ncbi:MAG: response regulator [Caldilineaceae bacterium]|nr:response regulator [Caldilineaceae bacterium]HRJ42753.1 response regulator [Caldilineaceae bacterium]
MKNNAYYVLVVSDGAETTNQIQRIFAVERNFALQFTSSCQEALRVLGQHNHEIEIILVDNKISDASPLETVRRLAILAPSVPIISITEQSAVGYVQEVLLAGARAFLTRPLNDSDVIGAVNQLLQLESIRRSRQAEINISAYLPQCEIITIVSPKGGAGTTTLAVNLAVAIRERTEKGVVLVDGQGSFGDLSTALNLQVDFSLGDILEHGDEMDADLVVGVLSMHPSGLRVLPSSQRLDDAESLTPEIFEKVLHILSQYNDVIIVDAGSIFESQTRVALSKAGKLLLVTTPEITSLRRCGLFLRAAEENGFPREKIQLVVNRDGLPGGLALDDISQSLNMQVALAIPDDPGLVTYSLNRGIPFVTGNPRSMSAKRIVALADALFPQKQAATAEAEPSKSLFSRFSLKLRGSSA